MKKIILGILISQSFLSAAALAAVKKVNAVKSVSIATVHWNDAGKKRAYFLRQNPLDKKILLVVLSNGKSHMKPISEALASHIQADLIDLAWKAKYKSTVKPGPNCHEMGSMLVGSNPKALESASVCKEQVKESKELASITYNMDQLLK
jgi:hypothetical protein